MAETTLYKLLTGGEWEAAKEAGVYRGSAHDVRDGFIHFSTADQLGETARKYFRGVSDLVLLTVDVRALELAASLQAPGAESALRWEPSRGGDLFPHLYAELPTSAVKSSASISLAEDGTPLLSPFGFA